MFSLLVLSNVLTKCSFSTSSINAIYCPFKVEINFAVLTLPLPSIPAAGLSTISGNLKDVLSRRDIRKK